MPSATLSAKFDSTFTTQPTITGAVTSQGIWLATGLGQNVVVGGASTPVLNLTGTATLNGNPNTGILLDNTGNFGLSLSAVTTTLTNSTNFFVNNTGTLTIGALNLAGKALTLAGTNASGTTLISGVIGTTSTAGSLIVNTTGAVTLSGTNTFVGGTTLTAGTLNLNNAKALGGAAGVFAINGGTINNTSGTAIASGSNNNPITIGGNFAFSTAVGAAATSLNLGTGAVSLAANQIVTINGAGTLTLGGTLTNTGDSVRTLTVSNGSTTTTNGSLALGGYALTGTGSTAARTDIINGDGNVNITGAVTNGVNPGSGLAYSGAGSLTLGGVNTFTGGLTLNSGTLNVNSTTALGAAASTFTINGGILNNSAGAARTIINNNPVVIGGSFQFGITGGTALANLGLGTGAVSLGQDTTVTNFGAAILTMGALTNTADSARTLTATLGTAATGSLSFGGYALTGAGSTAARNDTINGTANVAITGPVTDGVSAGSGLIKGGSSTLTLSGVNTFTGGLFINQGTVSATTSASALGGGGTGAVTLGSATVGSGATLQIGALTYANPITLASGSTGTLTLANTASGAIYAGGVSGNNALTITNSGTATSTLTFQTGDIAVAGLITFNGTSTGTTSITSNITSANTGGITLNTPGATLAIRGTNNTYGGTTTVTAGTLFSDVTNSFSPASSIVLNNAANAGLSFTASQNIGALSGGGGLGGNVNTGTGTTPTNLTVGGLNTSPAAYAGIISGTGGITKVGSGVLTLSGANTYTGTTNVDGGTLRTGASEVIANTNTVNIVGGTLDLQGNTETITQLPILYGGSVLGTSGSKLIFVSTVPTPAATTATTTLVTGASSISANLQLSTANTAVRTFTLPNSLDTLAVTGNLTEASGVTAGITKAGLGTLTLSGTNAYTGVTTINGGILNVGSAGALGGGGNITFTGGTLQYSAGNTLDYASRIIGSNATGPISIDTNGQNVNFASGLASSNVGGLTKNGAGTLTLAGTNAYTLGTTVNGGTLNVTGSIAGSTLTVNSGATATLAGINTNNGTTTINAGTLNLDYTNAAGSRLADGVALNLAGASVNLSGGAVTEIVNGIGLNAGASTITQTSGGSKLQLGGFTRAVGGTFDLVTGGIATTTTSNATGILAYGVVGTTGAADFAAVATSGTTVTPISAYAGYTALPATGGTGTVNYSNADAFVLTGSVTGNSLKLSDTTAGAFSVGAGNTLSLASGGLLFVGGSDYSIDGGTLVSTSAAGSELIVHQFGAGNLTISSTISNNTSASSVTKSGPGTLILSGANTFTGPINVVQGTLAAGVANTAFSNASVVNLSTGTTLDLSAAGMNETVAALANSTAGTGTVNLGANTLTLGNTTATNTTYAGVITGTGGVTKTGTNTQTLGGTNTYTGPTTITGGVLVANTVANVNTPSAIGTGTGTAADLVLNGTSAANPGTLQYLNSTTTGNTDRLLTLGAFGALDSSSATASSTLNFTNTGAIAFTGTGAHNLILTGTNAGAIVGSSLGSASPTNTSYFAPQITDQSAGNLTSVTKNGTGIWTLTNAANSYSGGTTINAGRINEFAPGQLGTGTITVNGNNATATSGTLLLASAGNYTNPLILSGIGASTTNNTAFSSGTSGSLVLNNGANQVGTVTLAADTRFSASAQFQTATGANVGQTGTISGQITGPGGIDFNPSGANSPGTVTISNPLNNYQGTTTFSIAGSGSSSFGSIVLGTSNVIPNGVGAGNVVFGSFNYGGGIILALSGFNETINGLVSVGYGVAGNSRQIQNNSATTASTLTVGDNNATANYIGQIGNGGTATLATTKIGSGTQSLSGISSYTGGSTVTAGTLQGDFTLFTTAAAATTAAANFLPTTGQVTLSGGTLSLLGRPIGTNNGTYTVTNLARNGVTLPAGALAGLSPGQAVSGTISAGSPAVPTPATGYVISIDPATNTAYLSFSAISGTTVTFTAQTTSTTTQTLAGLTLASGSSGLAVNDNGSGNTLLTAGAITRNGGSTLNITLPVTGGATPTNGVTTTSTTQSNGVVTSVAGTAYATVAGTTWASVPATGTTLNITALGTAQGAYNANSFTTNDNSDVSGAQAPGQFTSNTLRFNAAGATLDVSGAGASTISTGGILVTAATAGASGVTINNTSGGGSLRAGAGRELVVINNGALTVNAPIVDSVTAGGSALTISGAGTTTLTTANTYTGTTTINGGTYTPGTYYTNSGTSTTVPTGTTLAALPVQTVYVNGGVFNATTPAASTSGLGSGPVVVNNNGTLAGTGVINTNGGVNTTTINGGGNVSPGAVANTVGTLTLVSNVTFASTTGMPAAYIADITAGSSDLLQINGALNLGGTFDQLLLQVTATGAASYQLITASGGITGTFDSVLNLPTGYTLTYLANEIDLTNGMVAVPEPGTWAAGALMVLTAGYTARRRSLRKAA